MILDQPIDPTKISQLSESEKIDLLKKAYHEFIGVVNAVSEEQKEILDKALHEAEQKKIEEVRQTIAEHPES